MKKAIIFVILFALVCALLCGCTPPEAESGQPGQNGIIPALETGQVQTRPQPGENGSDPQTPDTEPAAINTTNPVADSVPEDDDSELETVSDFVVDGGAGFGFGGN